MGAYTHIHLRISSPTTGLSLKLYALFIRDCGIALSSFAWRQGLCLPPRIILSNLAIPSAFSPTLS
ncbi:hypothetical protein IF1G_00524 [Cordyceps javanica]|uniref:Uncharacterized protein n=1 Tax=Cordyceps javanica TaxID=43265 RepID=A0A545VFV0_9HYPO|nr:hypothetical protein IF1G_00524 [Cordyceps javanica]